MRFLSNITLSYLIHSELFDFSSSVKIRVACLLSLTLKLVLIFPDLSNTSRIGFLPAQSLVFKCGLSVSTVFVPTKIASSSLRHLCTSCREKAVVIQMGFN